MAQPAPGSARVMLQTIVSDPKVRAGLSPQAYAAFQAADQQFQRGDLSIKDFEQQVSSNPALQSAFQEAQQKGLLSSWLDKWGPVLGLGVVAALTGGTALLPTAAAASAPTGGSLAALGAPGTAAVTGGSAVAATAPAITDLATAGTVAGPGAAALTGGAAAAGPFSGLVSGLASHPSLVAAGLGLGGNLINAYEQGKSTDAQTKAAQDALALQTTEYNNSRADQAPYRNAGSAAINNLGFLLGEPGYTSPSSGNTLAPGMPQPANGPPVKIPNVGTVTPQTVTRNTDGSVQSSTGSISNRGPITLRAPTGQTRTFQPNDPAIQGYLNMPGVTQVNA